MKYYNKLVRVHLDRFSNVKIIKQVSYVQSKLLKISHPILNKLKLKLRFLIKYNSWKLMGKVKVYRC